MNNKLYQFWQQGNHPIELSSNEMNYCEGRAGLLPIEIICLHAGQSPDFPKMDLSRPAEDLNQWEELRHQPLRSPVFSKFPPNQNYIPLQ